MFPWPLKVPDNKRFYPDSPGQFGAIRRHDIHTGVDLYCELNTKVISIEDGEVIDIIPFTGIKAESPWWNDTQIILVKTKEYVIGYGEISESYVKVGDFISSGDVIANIGVSVLKKFKNRPMVMLHLEKYKVYNKEEPIVTWNLNQPCPENLLDPTDLLNNFIQFDINKYDFKFSRNKND